MSPEELVERSGEQMRAAGWAVAPVESSHARGYVAYHLSKFRIRWIGKLDLSVFVVATPALTVDALTSITEWSVDRTRREKGVPRDFIGVAVALAMVTSTPDPRVRSVVEAGLRPSALHVLNNVSDIFIERAIVDADKRVVYGNTRRLTWGATYRPWIHSQLKAVLPLPDATWPWALPAD